MGLTFVLVTALTWAHTSHRSHLDVYLMVLGALALLAFRPGSAGGPGRLLFDPPRPLPVE